MKYKSAYREINSILELVGQKPIEELDNCRDNIKQLDHLRSKYIDMYLAQFPKWEAFRDRPEMINDIGMQILVEITKAT